MPAPIMTPKDVAAVDEAFKEYKSAQQALYEAFRNRKPREEIDTAIRMFQEKETAWAFLRDKFYQRWPR
jgi:hypothetical protein